MVSDRPARPMCSQVPPRPDRPQPTPRLGQRPFAGERALATFIPGSNRGFGQWGEVFGDPIIATAILDRLLHHSVTINIKGESYRLKEKQKAGVLKQAVAPA
jgi:hypothetical protein